jgi:hypothetical protein
MNAEDIFKVAGAIVLSIGGAGVVLFALSGFLAKVWANRILEGDRARYSAEMEHLKAKLESQGFEHRTRFSLFHQKRSDAIADLYGKLWYASALVSDMVSPVQFGDEAARKERTNTAYDAVRDLEDHFYRREIYFEPAVCEKVRSILKATRLAISNWQMSQNPGWRDRGGVDLWVKAHETMDREVPPVLSELKEQFRAAISGIELTSEA